MSDNANPVSTPRPPGAVPLGFFEIKNDEDMEFAIEQLLAALRRSGVKFKGETEEE